MWEVGSITGTFGGPVLAEEYRFANLESLPSREVRDGVHMRFLAGSKLMFSLTRLEPHSIVPTHQHPHEQLGVVLEGEIELWIEDERRTLRPGDAFVVPGGIRHGALATERPAVVLDAFHPVREDYLALIEHDR